MSHRHLRFLAILALVLAGSLGAIQPLDAPSPARAEEHEGEAIITLPVRWCAVEGTTAASDPATINDTLFERTVRASDDIWLLGAQIKIQGALTAAGPVPIVPDPSVALGNPGDIVDPRDDRGSELNTAIASCREAWDSLAMSSGSPLPGPIALNVGGFVNGDNSPADELLGWGGYTTWAPKTEHPCDSNSDLISASGGFFAVVDSSVMGDPAQDARLVAHELGHVLYLSHGNGMDDDDDTFYDKWCDPWEPIPDPGETVMHSDILTTTDDITTLQRGTSRDIAYVYTGSQIDTGDGPVNGPTVSDQRADVAGDVGAPSVDLTYVELVVQEENLEFLTITLTHGLLGLVLPDETNRYLAFIDLDNDPITGGSPAEFDFPTQMTGVEVVTQVAVDQDRSTSQTVLWFDGETFVDVTGDVVDVQLTSPEGGEEATPLFDVVTMTVNLPLEALETMGEQVNIQAVAMNDLELDVVPGEAGDGSSDESVPLFIVEPEF
jgi:hypothetical protein